MSDEAPRKSYYCHQRNILKKIRKKKGNPMSFEEWKRDVLMPILKEVEERDNEEKRKRGG